MKHSQWRPVALSLTVAGAVVRLLPHPPNFAPVGALSLFAGARLPVWQAYAVPVVLMLVTDPILNVMNGYPAFNFHPFSYLSFLIAVWIGRRLAYTESAWRIGCAALISSVQFFLISNFGAWLSGYPHTLAGLSACYIAALPFFERTVLSDLFFTAVLFGLHSLLSRRISLHERIPATA
jgi:hypothetical protein